MSVIIGNCCFKQAVRMATEYASAPLQVDNIFTFIRQVAPVPACWLFQTSTSWPLTFWPWKWRPCDVGYLCANFSLPRPLFSS